MAIKHPSGRPINRPAVKPLSIFRGAGKGSELPRLRDDVRDLSLIGFHHSYREMQGGDDDDRA